MVTSNWGKQTWLSSPPGAEIVSKASPSSLDSQCHAPCSILQRVSLPSSLQGRHAWLPSTVAASQLQLHSKWLPDSLWLWQRIHVGSRALQPLGLLLTELHRSMHPTQLGNPTGQRKHLSTLPLPAAPTGDHFARGGLWRLAGCLMRAGLALQTSPLAWRKKTRRRHSCSATPDPRHTGFAGAAPRPRPG